MYMAVYCVLAGRGRLCLYLGVSSGSAIWVCFLGLSSWSVILDCHLGVSSVSVVCDWLLGSSVSVVRVCLLGLPSVSGFWVRPCLSSWSVILVCHLCLTSVSGVWVCRLCLASVLVSVPGRQVQARHLGRVKTRKSIQAQRIWSMPHDAACPDVSPSLDRWPEPHIPTPVQAWIAGLCPTSYVSTPVQLRDHGQ